jgi:hypothetical protein
METKTRYYLKEKNSDWKAQLVDTRLESSINSTMKRRISDRIDQKRRFEVRDWTDPHELRLDEQHRRYKLKDSIALIKELYDIINTEFVVIEETIESKEIRTVKYNP